MIEQDPLQTLITTCQDCCALADRIIAQNMDISVKLTKTIDNLKIHVEKSFYSDVKDGIGINIPTPHEAN